MKFLSYPFYVSTMGLKLESFQVKFMVELLPYVRILNTLLYVEGLIVLNHVHY